MYRVKDNVQCITLPPPPRPGRAISYIVIKCLVFVVHVCQKRMRNLNTESITLFLWVHYIDDILRFQVTNWTVFSGIWLFLFFSLLDFCISFSIKSISLFLQDLPEFWVEWFDFRKFNRFRIFWKLLCKREHIVILGWISTPTQKVSITSLSTRAFYLYGRCWKILSQIRKRS